MAYEKYKEESYNNSGGINVKASEYLTGVNEVLDLRNYTFVRPGKWTSRPGVEVSYSLARSTFTLAPRSNISYVKDDGSSYQFFDSGSTLYLRGTNAAVAGSLATGATSPLLDAVTQNNYLYYANGFAFKRYEGTNDLNWNVESGASGIARFRVSTGLSGAVGITFNVSLTPYNGMTVVLSALDFTTNILYSFAGTRNSYSLQTVAMSYKMFKNSYTATFLTTMQSDNSSGFSLPGAPTFVGMGQWVIYGFTMRPVLGISSLIVQKAVTYGITQASITGFNPNGRDIQYATNILYSQPVSFSASFFPGVSINPTEAVAFDHFNSTEDYRFQDALAIFPKYLQTYNNMLFMANITGTSLNPGDKPSTVYYSDLGRPEEVDPENFFEIRAGNGDVITGMCNYQTNLLIFKQFSVHEVSGTSPETLTLNDLTLEFGAVNNRAIVAFENLVYFVDPTGIIEYNGSSFNDISSDKIKTYLDQVDKTNMSATHIKKNNQVVFSASNKSLVFDYVARAWSIFDNLAIDQNAGPAYFAYGASVKDLTYWQSGASFHQSVRFNDQLTTDFGLPITLAIKTRFHKRLGESTQELFRRFFLNTSTSGTSLNAVTLNMYPDYGSSVYLQRNFTISTFQQRIDFGVSAKSLSIEILIQSSQSLSVNGYTIESRYLRSV